MTLDIDKIRAETPGIAHVTHLLASGSGLMPQPVIDAIIDHTLLESRIGGYEAHTCRAAQLDAVYDDVASLIGADSDEIALLENATAAWCQAFYTLPFKPGDRILTCEAEYAANYVAFLQRAKRDGIVIDVVPSDETGAVSLDAMQAMIDDRVALISLTWVPTNGGLVNPVPVSACRSLGADLVIGVNLNSDILRRHDAEDRATSAEQVESVFGSLKKQAREYSNSLFVSDDEADKTPGLFATISNTINIFQDQITRSRFEADPADVLIAPKVGDIGMFDFQRAADAIIEGEACVENAMSEIQRLAGAR